MNNELTQVQEEKKAYTTPTLTTHGDVASLTQHHNDVSGIIPIPWD